MQEKVEETNNEVSQSSISNQENLSYHVESRDMVILPIAEECPGSDRAPKIKK